MGDFSKGGGKYTKPMVFEGVWKAFLELLKLSDRGVYFGKYGNRIKLMRKGQNEVHSALNCYIDYRCWKHVDIFMMKFEIYKWSVDKSLEINEKKIL